MRTGWQPGSNRLDLTLTDATGKPLEADVVAVELIRPAERRMPIDVAMTGVGSGKFTGSVALPARGNWDADIVIEARGNHFALTKRLFLQ